MENIIALVDRDGFFIDYYDKNSKEFRMYVLNYGEKFIDKKINESSGKCKAQWTGSEWIETATEEEYKKWKYPLGEPDPNAPIPKSKAELEEEIKQISGNVDLTQVCTADAYSLALATAMAFTQYLEEGGIR